jgi:hypothetical protein
MFARKHAIEHRTPAGAISSASSQSPFASVVAQLGEEGQQQSELHQRPPANAPADDQAALAMIADAPGHRAAQSSTSQTRMSGLPGGGVGGGAKKLARGGLGRGRAGRAAGAGAGCSWRLGRPRRRARRTLRRAAIRSTRKTRSSRRSVQ